MDNLVFEESITTETDTSEFTEKKWVYVNDNNSQNYSSQVVIDSTPLSNAGGYVNWSEAYILMPLVIEATGASGLDNASAPALVAMKNGYWNMINSMSIEFNNQTIVQQTPFLNVFRSFKAHTSFAESDVVNHGAELGYALDSAESWGYNSAVGPEAGIGLWNNRYVEATSGYVGVDDASLANKGLAQRIKNVALQPITSSGNGKQHVITHGKQSELYQSRVVSQTATAIVWEIYAKLRLKDLSEYFEKCPLLKGSTMRFLINTNQAEVSITRSTADLNAVSASVLGGNTCPFMITSQRDATATLSGGKQLVPDGSATRVSCDIYKGRQSQHTTALSSVRLYAPLYRFNPLAEQRYLSLAPTKRVEYNDVFQYQFDNISAGATFNFLVSNGIADIQSVLVVPFLSASANGDVNSLLSPYSTAGATPDPIPLQQFNILLSGVNLFLENEDYDFQAFAHQLASSNQLNGGLTTGLGSGLIGKREFENLYRYYYGDASRSLPSEEGVSKSVQIVGKNASAKSVSLMVFVEFKREMTIDIQTGARVS
jgi:hypothetical protein